MAGGSVFVNVLDEQAGDFYKRRRSAAGIAAASTGTLSWKDRT